MNSLCLPKVAEMIKKYRLILILYFAMVLAIAAVFGFKKYKSAGAVSPDYLEKMEEYESGLNDIDGAITKNKEAISAAQQQADKIQEYLDNSIYMKLDAKAAKSLSLQYKLSGKDKKSTPDKAAKLIKSYITGGGLIADIQELDQDKENAYLNEVLTCTIDYPSVTINLMHYSDEKIGVLQPIIDNSILLYADEISAKFGGIELSKIKEATSEKKNSTVLEKQNKEKQLLRDAKVKISDLKAKTATLIQKKTTYIDKTKPAAVETDPVKALIKGTAAVILIGIILLIFVFWMILTFGNIVSGRADIERTGIEVLGYYKHGKGFTPDASAIAQNIKLVADHAGTNKVFIQNFGSEKKTSGCISKLADELNKDSIECIGGNQLLDSGAELKLAMESKCCLMIAEVGSTKVSDIKCFIKLCEKFGMHISGAVAV